MTVERDLSAEAFLSLRGSLFDENMVPTAFALADKRNTQNDPLDEHLIRAIAEDIADESTVVQPSSGPLISPDMALLDPTALMQGASAAGRSRAEVVGIEVKKLERTASGKVARATGLDFNTTPPSERIQVLDNRGQAVTIPASYLFLVLEDAESEREVNVTSLTLCDGAVLNEDYELYQSIVGTRKKRIGLGTYGDGVDRQRPMLIFTNPLSVTEFDGAPTLISARSDLQDRYDGLAVAGTLARTRGDGSLASFTCYRANTDLDAESAYDLLDPFPSPVRSESTHGRGRFRLSY